MEDIVLRIAAPDDAGELLGIYAPYVENTAVSFEYEVPSIEEFTARIAATLKRYPYIVAERCGEVVGYAYAGPFKSRAAYDRAVETSVYVSSCMKGRGVGRLLYSALEMALKEQHIINLNACIAYIEEADEYLTPDSARFHASLGYRMVGKFTKCGYKFGRWYDMVWMEKLLGDHPEHPGEVIPFENIKVSFEKKLLAGEVK